MTHPNDNLGFAQRKRDGKPNGIHFAEDGSRTLWLADQEIATGILSSQDDLYAYFYELRFLEVSSDILRESIPALRRAATLSASSVPFVVIPI